MSVSVIMNCHNGEQYLAETLQSLRNQTFQDFEIIFWDNCSTDQSAAIARNYGSQLRYFRAESMAPLGRARNLAIAQASGDYIAFLDCDDIWLPQKLEKQMDLLRQNPKLGLVCTDTEIFQGQKVIGRFFKGAKPARGQAFAELVRRQFVSMSSAIVSRAAIDATRDPLYPQMWFDERLNVCEEADLFYRIAHDFEIDYVDEPLTRWRRHNASATFRKFAQFAAETQIILDKQRRLYANYDTEHADLAQLLTQRAAFQKALALWRKGKGNAARAGIAPYLGAAPKYRLFWLASFLPGRLFDLASAIYFKLPEFMRP